MIHMYSWQRYESCTQHAADMSEGLGQCRLVGAAVWNLNRCKSHVGCHLWLQRAVACLYGVLPHTGALPSCSFESCHLVSMPVLNVFKLHVCSLLQRDAVLSW